MCGILVSISKTNDCQNDNEWKILKELNKRRGPDAQQEIPVKIDQTDRSPVYARFFSTVLHLRGPNVVEQPLTDHKDNILCWNGEVFDGIPIAAGENDTRIVMEHLSRSTTADLANDHHSTGRELLKVISKLEGPFAFVFYEAQKRRLWFGRDCLGRRSLLWRRTENGLTLSSVAFPVIDAAWEEVPAKGIYCLRLDDIGQDATTEYQPTLYPWQQREDYLDTDTTMPLPFHRVNTTVPLLGTESISDQDPPMSDAAKAATEAFSQLLGDSVRRRVADIPFIQSQTNASRVAILFSGGIDCTCLALLANLHLPAHEPIDLINVAFENPRVDQARRRQQKPNQEAAESSDAKSVYDTPDRKTGRVSLAELNRIAPDRPWRFVEVNVPYAEAQAHRQEIIDRMYPLNTVMDLSIAMAFWFAARGNGSVDGNPYTSRARVLLSGLGADEQLAGYSRHSEAFRQNGWDGLIKEIQLDVDRISTRNLGRDDRIMSDHGKEVRFPFLSTSVVDWLCQLEVQLKADMRYGRGIGEKLLLRNVSRHLGLTDASRHWKRAIQFGAKTAKMTDGHRHEKGQQTLS